MVEFLVERSVEVSQPAQDLFVDWGVWPALRLSEAAGVTASLGLLQARKAFGGVEEEVLVGDDALQTQEVLNAGQFPRRISDQSLAVDEVNAPPREVLQPAL